MFQGQGYVDDSGSHEGGLYVLAGYVMPAPKWAAFSDEWKECLKKEPKIAYFKSHEAMTQQSEFLGKRVDVCDHKVKDLADIIHRSAPICLATSVTWSDYREVFGGKLPNNIDDPYFILFYRILELMMICQQDIAEVERYDKVDFTFDEQGKLIVSSLFNRSLWGRPGRL
jgi:hypothetical protein